MLSIYETEKRRFAQDMLPHYLECATWADLPEDAETGIDFAPCAEELALADCMRFTGLNWEIIKESNPEQVGHDFWLTRQGHGAGFWDRPEIYGSDDNAEKLSNSARSLGYRDVFEHNGQLMIE